MTALLQWPHWSLPAYLLNRALHHPLLHRREVHSRSCLWLEKTFLSLSVSSLITPTTAPVATQSIAGSFNRHDTDRNHRPRSSSVNISQSHITSRIDRRANLYFASKRSIRGIVSSSVISRFVFQSHRRSFQPHQPCTPVYPSQHSLLQVCPLDVPTVRTATVACVQCQHWPLPAHVSNRPSDQLLLYWRKVFPRHCLCISSKFLRVLVSASRSSPSSIALTTTRITTQPIAGLSARSVDSQIH